MCRMLAALCAALSTLGLGTAILAGPALAKGPKPPQIKKVKFTGTPAAPTITVRGIGLGSFPAGATEPPLECFPPEPEPGNDFNEAAYFEELTQGWQAGHVGDCIGLVFSTYTESEVVFHFGTGYREYVPLAKGDGFQVTLNGLVKTGTIKLK